MENLYNTETGCCVRFDPAGWDGTEHRWQDKPFIADKITAVGHIPLNMGKVIRRCWDTIIGAEAATPAPPIMLCDETSPWKTLLYIETAKDIPAASMTHISGTFVSKVFEGPYKDAPKCAKHYGNNYVVLLAKID